MSEHDQPTGPAAYLWDDDAVGLMTHPHDRPAPSVRSPCVSWGFALRPVRADDPIDAGDPFEERKRRTAWLKRLNTTLGWLQDPTFRLETTAFPGDEARLRLRTRFGEDATEDGASSPSIGSVYFHTLWRDIPGFVQVEAHTEFATVLIGFGLRLNRRAMLRRRIESRTADDIKVGGSETYAELWRALELLGRTDRDLGVEGPGWRTLREDRFKDIERARDVVYRDLWDVFLSDLEQVARREGDRPAGPLFPGRAFASMRMAAVRTDREWIKDDGKVSVDPLRDQDRFEILRARGQLIDRIFPESPDREFVAHGAERSRHVFLSSLDSTLAFAQAQAAETGAPPSPEPTRSLILLEGRAESHQLGRLIERLHALRAYRLAALFDLRSLRAADSALRHLAKDLDKATLDFFGSDRVGATKELTGLFQKLQNLGAQTRGGMSYRISRSVLYVTTFDQRVAELKIQPIPTWQPYDEFIHRRQQRTFDFIKDVGERRDRLSARLTLLIERLQWTELNAVQRGAERTLRATDTVAYVGLVLGAGAIGGAIGSPIDESLRGAFADQDVARKIGLLLGAAIGLALGGLVSYGIYLWRKRADAAAEAEEMSAAAGASAPRLASEGDP